MIISLTARLISCLTKRPKRCPVALLLEGSEVAVAAQLDAARSLLGGEEADPWDEARARQGAAAGRLHFERLEPFLCETHEAVVRVAAGVGYVPDELPESWSSLAERVRSAFDPDGKLA